MTLLALTLAVGIVIDDAIIVLENISASMEEKGLDRVQASIEATREIGLAVMATYALAHHHLPAHCVHGPATPASSESFGWTMAIPFLSLVVAFTAHADDEFAAPEAGRKEQGRRYLGSLEVDREFLPDHCCAGRWHIGASIMLICLATFLSTFGLISPGRP